MALKIGIVGLPNVGKSTLFTALTKKQVETHNYAFTTIEPNVGIVDVPDERLQQLSNMSHSEKTIPAMATFVDIAGLVKDAHKGEGLGNQFLANIREVHALVHVLRDFSNSNVTHVHGEINAQTDYEVIEMELILADVATLDKRTDAVEGKARSGDKESKKTLTLYEALTQHLGEGKPARDFSVAKEMKPLVDELHLLTAKPELRVYNVDESNASKEFKDGIAISAKIESELAELPSGEAQSLLSELGMKEAGLNRLIRHAYTLLGLITFFTSGEKETRGWSIEQHTTAKNAAGAIHSDFAEQFIKAEVIHWKDFVAYKGETGAKEKGKMHLEGKDYNVQDGDVMYFHTSA